MTASRPNRAFLSPPDPGTAGTIEELVGALRSLKAWAGDPSYQVITMRINAAWTQAGRTANELARRGTVVDCFKAGRRRVNTELVVAVVEALYTDAGYAAQWRQALRVVEGETRAASQVRVQGTLPPDLVEFTGRVDGLARLSKLARRDDAAVVFAIDGMPGVGKSRVGGPRRPHAHA